ncbi:phosphatidylinositol phosphatase PTPRQ-like isoform X1 [Diorhabda sublineata]|uniref:phosphatidylinositol phosphatase PTPRQ-like isoform X1 n=1 Tax=Diorhabda sublineata TaxID=1163346 RepID=UPI0024E14ADB|nr:phosphatidylinositol phosphatase PTPRQ-like isoform X1 [Diorhabda sublineata]
MKVFVVFILNLILILNEKVVFSTNSNTTVSANDETDAQLNNTTIESTNTESACPEPNPPTLFYNESNICWYIDADNQADCLPNEIHLSCDSSTNVVNENFNYSNHCMNINDDSYEFYQGVRYTCTATASTDSSTSTDSSPLIVPPGTGEISPITFNGSQIAWSPPFENVTLIYKIKIFSWISNHYIPKECSLPANINDETTELSFDLIAVPADFSFNIEISTEYWNISVRADKILSTPSKVPGAPTDIEVQDIKDEESIVSYIIHWSMPCDSNGNITGFYLLLTNNNFELNDSIEITQLEDRYTYNLPELTPNEIYQVQLYAVGINGNGESAYYEFSTNEGVPTAPTFDDPIVASTFFTLKWTAPENFTDGRIAKIALYKINITPTGPNYNRKNGSCPNPDKKYIELNGTELSYNFTEAWPQYDYEISLNAATTAGDGPSTIISITTDSAEPEAPQNLQIMTTVNDKNMNNIKGTLTWDAPCKMNGALERYVINISERYTEDSSDVEPEIQKINSTEEYVMLNLQPSHYYTFDVTAVLVSGETGMEASNNITTIVGIPGVPEIITNDSSSNNFTISWQSPKEKVGPIAYFYLNIIYINPLYDIPTGCQIIDDEIDDRVEGNIFEYTVTDVQPYTAYQVQLKASTIQGNGSYTAANISTIQAVPENVREVSSASFENELNDDYKATATITFSPPCNTYGNDVSYSLECVGHREGYDDHNILDTTEIDTYFHFGLRPEHLYACKIHTRNEIFENSIQLEHFLSPAGVPSFGEDFRNISVENVSPHEVSITLKENYLNMSQGNIKYMALILSEENIFGNVINRWDGTAWPFVNTSSQQITENGWDPFENSTEIDFIIGQGTAKNPLLKDDTQYYLVIRIFTNSFYRDSESIAFKTDKLSQVSTIVGVIMSLLVLSILGVAGFYIWKKGIYKKFPAIYRKKTNSKLTSTTAIPIKKFIQYFKNCEHKPDILKQQFALLTTTADEIEEMHTSKFASLPENKRKNRYTNISPFDATRVKLLIDEDDEIGSDYINASYINGFSGKVEYLATQGPLVSTHRDFWRMVIQENVSIIVMVSNFVENNKQKCHKYFPQNHENMFVGDNIEIRCATELHFGAYVVRNLLVRKDCLQVTITHMQFLDWPDFKVPTGTDNMLQFCHQLRERVRLEGGMVIVHCSAGVGRTGTLIAADILLQTVNSGKEIDIYNTVLNLRKQRVKMVQTEEQYIYIHRLVADHIDRPQTPDSTDGEHMYENSDIIKKSKTNDFDSNTENESQF